MIPSPSQNPKRLAERDIVFANGSTGCIMQIPSASPSNYHQAISQPGDMERVTIDGQLFRPPGAGSNERLPLVIVVPGSLGVAVSHLAHAEALTELGIAAFVLDPFGARNVASTVADQTRFSFAASAYDVLAAWKVLSARGDIDSARMGAQGHSRGGSAVLTAATRRFADPAIGRQGGFKAVLAAYPWSGHQFLNPDVGGSEVRVLMGDRDDWCSPMQVQSHVHAICLTGGKATLRLFAGAAHSFDRGTPIQRVNDAAVAPGAPTAYITDEGAFVHPLTSDPNPHLRDRDLMVYALKAGYGLKGASVGGSAEQAADFHADMSAFWRRTLLA